MFFDPSGHLAISQYPAFLWHFGTEGIKITFRNMSTTTKLIESFEGIITVGGALYRNELTLNDLIGAIGKNAWDGLSGDLRYIISNASLFDPNHVLSSEQLIELAQRSAGAYEELMKVGGMIYGAVKTAQGIAASRAMTKNLSFSGTRNSASDFMNTAGKSTLSNHYSKHGSSLGFSSEQKYLSGARSFLTKRPTLTTQSFTSSMGWYFRYDTATNEFGIINQYGGISTYFKPVTGFSYWLDQIKLYAPK